MEFDNGAVVEKALSLGVGRYHSAVLGSVLDGKAGQVQDFLAFDGRWFERHRSAPLLQGEPLWALSVAGSCDSRRL
jgi:hypothetical protein